MLAEQLKLLEEERVLAERELLEQEEIKKRQMEEQERRLEEKRKLAEEANLLRDRKMNEEMELKRKQQQVRRESFEKRQEIIRQLAETSSRSSSVVSSKQKVKDWLNGHDTGRSDGDIAGQVNTLNQIPEDPVNIPSAPFPLEPYNPVNPQPVGQVIASSMNQFSMHPVDPSFLAPASVPLDPEHPRPLRHGYQQHSIVPLTPVVAYSLSQAQIAARQVLGKDLPAFNGNPEDWPIFISNFEQSSATCGYSDAENLVRLQRSLKGHALESVKSRLLLPASVPHVIQTLRTLYGRPELIIRSLMSKIQHVAAPRHDRLETLIQFGLSVQNFVDHLKAANHQNHLSNPVLMQQLVEKLPGSMKLDWAVFKNKNQPANLETFGDFMSGLVTAASEVSFDLPGLSNNISKNDRHKPRDFGAVYSHSGERAPFTSTDGAPNNTKASKPCAACGRAGHRVSDCHQFQNASVDERWELVQQKGLCRTCLNSHGKWPCRSWNSCGIEECRQKHHTLLHTDSPRLENLGISASHVSSEEFKWPLFRIVPVTRLVRTQLRTSLPVTLFNNDNSQTIFAFIDEGSSYTLLEESVATQLETSGQIEPLTLQWTGNVKRVEPKSQRVQIEISGRSCATRYKLMDARTVGRLVLPSQTLNYGALAKRFPHLRGLPLNDYELIQPKLLIGLDNLRLCVPLKLREGRPSDPIGAKCRLGWSIYGCIPGQSSKTAVVSLYVAAAPDQDRELNEQLRDYFALENVGVSNPYEYTESDEEKRAKKLLVDTTQRVQSGCAFETGLLWKSDHPDFPDSYPMALRRLEALERKLQMEPALGQRVREQIVEYERKGYAHKANLIELTSVEAGLIWYLPLGVVTNPRKPEKVRLIWDAAAKVGNISFNSKLLKGPDLLTPLPKVLYQFRQYPVAVCGDIMEMFHQIRIRSPDNQSQRFLFREKPTDHPNVYVMDVATFGSTCSPASAQFVKNLNAEKFSSEYPRASAAIINKHYVDDYLDSFETIHEAVAVVKEVQSIHSEGGFTLRHFLSNKLEVLQEIGEASGIEPKDLDLERGGKTESVLGIKWMPQEDVFVYSFGLREDL
ncbi:uncharacterized protein LOC109409081 [Aedes albopictus]|uniref:CCHC-type domain-containing protein n=1 Tax=Aedes albopictus TaxID=7160 RepID=A0ABM1Z0U0_AEDAL